MKVLEIHGCETQTGTGDPLMRTGFEYIYIYIGNGESLNIWEHGLQSEFACIYYIYIY